MKTIITTILVYLFLMIGAVLINQPVSYAEESNVSQDECMQLCIKRIKDCYGEVEQVTQMCEESFCSAPISEESRDCLRDTLCDTIASSITHKISICGIARKS